MGLQKTTILLILYWFLGGCSPGGTRSISVEGCTADKALLVTHEAFRKARFNEELYNPSMEVNDSAYVITYRLIGDNYGGGARFWVNKEDCRITDRKLYQ